MCLDYDYNHNFVLIISQLFSHFSVMDSEIDDEKPIIEEESNQEQLKITKRKIISKDNQKSVKRIKDELEDNDVKTLDEPKDAKSTKKIDKTEKKEEILEKKDASKIKITKTKQEQVEPELFSKSRLIHNIPNLYYQYIIFVMI